MKKWLRGALAGALMLSAALACGPAAKALADDSEKSAAVPVQAVHRGGLVVAGFGGMLNSEAHQKAYLTYLVKEYSPESMGQWEEAFTERKRVSESAPKEFVVRLKGAPSPDGPPAPGKIFRLKKDPAPSGSGGEAEVLPEERLMKLKIRSGDGTIPPGIEGLKDIVVKRGASAMTHMDFINMEEVKARADLMAEFEKAVESGNADSIRAVLPRVLEDYRETTARMARFQEDLKQEKAKQE